MKENILKGIRILDFTRVLAGPYATRLLADFGAEVIKVQSWKTATGAESNDEGYFNTWNRNKKSMALDMSFPEARKIILKLTTLSDVVIENFSPRVMANWNLGYEKLKEVRPDLVMASMSGMGQTGPWKNHVAFGPTVQSLGGLSYLTSYEKNAPTGLGNSYGDPVVGLYCAFAILAALEYRDRTGQGQYMDLSGYETICTAIAPALMDVLNNKKDIQPEGNSPDYIHAAPYGCYRCSGDDRWCVISVFDDNQWKNLCKAAGRPELANNEKYSTLSKRKENRKEVDAFIEQWTSAHTPEYVMEILQESGVPSGIVQDALNLAEDPHLAERNFFIHLKHPILGDTVSDTGPIKFSGADSEKKWKSAPLLGEDNNYVYRELLGFSERKISDYIKKGIIG